MKKTNVVHLELFQLKLLLDKFLSLLLEHTTGCQYVDKGRDLYPFAKGKSFARRWPPLRILLSGVPTPLCFVCHPHLKDDSFTQ